MLTLLEKSYLSCELRQDGFALKFKPYIYYVYTYIKALPMFGHIRFIINIILA